MFTTFRNFGTGITITKSRMPAVAVEIKKVEKEEKGRLWLFEG
ncbi:MAG: hypothetical protein ACXQTR_04335 [Candidatus Methanospirareceae archaeon]